MSCNRTPLLPVGESNVIGEEDHALGQLLCSVIPEGSALQLTTTAVHA